MKAVDRVDYIDIAKGIAISMVILGHIIVDENYTRYIYAFHLPVFFFISGVFCKPERYQSLVSFARIKAKTLLIPYVSLYLLSLIYWVTVESRTPFVVDLRTIKGLFYATDNGWMYPNGALWFLPALFVTEVLFYLTYKINHGKYPLLPILIGFAAVGSLLSYFGAFRLPFGINSSFMAVFFLGIGYLLKKQALNIDNRPNLISLLIALLLFLIMGCFAVLNQKPDMDYVKYGNPLLFILAAFSGIVATLYFSKGISPNRFLKFLGKNSLLIMGLQFPIIRGVLHIYASFTNQSEHYIRNSILDALMCSVLAIAVVVPFIFLFNRYFYVLLGKQKG
ncbi:MAG: acyltransferase family protein [Bacteroidales bacterium]